MIDPGAVAAIFLAAGRSSRFGAADKLLAPLDGTRVALRAAAPIIELAPARRIAVCPDNDGDLAMLLAAQGFEIVANPDADLGLSASLQLGIGTVARGREQAALLCLADMPFVRAAHLRALLARFDPETAPVVASSRKGVPMPPALFARALFDELGTATGDRGGRALLSAAALVAAPAAELADIDRPSDMPGQ